MKSKLLKAKNYELSLKSQFKWRTIRHYQYNEILFFFWW